MGSIAFQTPTPPQPAPWPATTCADTPQLKTLPTAEQVLAALTLILWGLVLPIDFIVSLLAI